MRIPSWLLWVGRRRYPAGSTGYSGWRPVTAAISIVLLATVLLVQPNSALSETLESRESQYNSVFVERHRGLITMKFGRNRRMYKETVVDSADPTRLPVVYTRYMTLPLAYAPDAGKVLEIGLGGGSTIWYLHQTFTGLEIDAVELDPVVAEMASKYFFVREDERLKVHVADGRRFIARSRTDYDVILIDAYRGPFVPFHLLTREFFESARARLTPGGVIAQNIDPGTMLYDAALATIGSVFEHVDVYPARQNFVVVAYDGPHRPAALLERQARQLDARYQPRYKLIDLLQARRQQLHFQGEILTDDFAPVESLHAIKRHNRIRVE